MLPLVAASPPAPVGLAPPDPASSPPPLAEPEVVPVAPLSPPALHAASGPLRSEPTRREARSADIRSTRGGSFESSAFMEAAFRGALGTLQAEGGDEADRSGVTPPTQANATHLVTVSTPGAT